MVVLRLTAATLFKLFTQEFPGFSSLSGVEGLRGGGMRERERGTGNDGDVKKINQRDE